MSATNYLEAKLLDHSLRNTAYTQPSGLYLALFSADPTDTGSFTNEAAGGSYARQSVTVAAATGTSPTTSATSNAQDFTMPAGTWTHWAICDASTAGNQLYNGALSASITTAAGGLIHFNAGDITVTAD